MEVVPAAPALTLLGQVFCPNPHRVEGYETREKLAKGGKWVPGLRCEEAQKTRELNRWQVKQNREVFGF